jgi:glycerophosphoryl diester phosphodiesterase
MIMFDIKSVLIAGTAAFLLIAGCRNNHKNVLVTGHRGASGLAPENTISAFLKAIALGADYSELDVQETADGVLVILHDPTLKRTAAVDKNIWETDYAALKEIDFGSWFSPEFKGEPIPTLAAVIDTVRGRMKLNIELKMNGHEKKLTEKVVKLVEQKNFISQCIITSFDFKAIDQVRALNRQIKAGYIFSSMPENVDVFTADVDLLSVNYKLIDKEFVDRAHANQKEVHVYTVNDPEEMKRLIGLGVDSIITNRPDVLIDVLRSL